MKLSSVNSSESYVVGEISSEFDFVQKPEKIWTIIAEFHKQGVQMFQWQQVHGAEQHQRSINNMEKQWAGGLLHQVNRFFLGTFITIFLSL